MSDRLQRLLQPKLLKLEYLHEKQSRVSSELERQALEKQIKEAEKEIQDINQLPEEALLGNRLDSHDWEKISNINVSEEDLGAHCSSSACKPSVVGTRWGSLTVSCTLTHCEVSSPKMPGSWRWQRTPLDSP